MASVEALAPYQPNAQGLTEVLIDLKSTMPSQTVFKMLLKVMLYIQELVTER